MLIYQIAMSQKHRLDTKVKSNIQMKILFLFEKSHHYHISPPPPPFLNYVNYYDMKRCLRFEHIS